MNDLLRGLRADLVERRLLPIAVLLVAGMIAIPVLATQKRSTATAGNPVTTSTTPVTTQTTPQATPDRRRSANGSRDPFSASGGSSGASRGSASQGPGTSTSGSTSSPSSSSSSASPTRTTSASQPLPSSGSGTSGRARKRWTLRSIDLRFGPAAKPTLRRNVARLSAFPTPRDPIVLMFGAMGPRNAVVFHLDAGVAVKGSGTCVPRVKLCTQLVLRPGQRVVLTKPNGKRYRLSVVRVRTTTTTSSRRARRAYARVSKAGQCVLDTFGAFGYDGSTGVVRRRSTGKGCRYAGAKPKVLGARR